ncbi:MAG: hypothetical protein ACRECU_02180 [Methylocella sp.]
MKGRSLSQIVIDKLAGHRRRRLRSPEQWERHLHALGLADLKVTPDPVLVASEGALWGAIRHQGLLNDVVVVSDDAGQFRVGLHALCWAHAERLVHKLVPANDKQRNAIVVAKRRIWWFYGSLKEYKLAPSAEQAVILRARFDRIFKRRTGYATLRLLKRLHRNKDDWLRVLQRPDIPLRRNCQRQGARRPRRHAWPRHTAVRFLPSPVQFELSGVDGRRGNGVSEAGEVFSVHPVGAHESNEFEKAGLCFDDLLQRSEQQEGDQGDRDLNSHRVSERPRNLVILSVCFMTRKNSSICQRRL